MNGRRSSPFRFAAALAMLGLVVACGPSPDSAAPVQTSRVDLPPSYRFDPPVIEVPAGTTVTWTNRDNFTHSVQVDGGQVHNLKPGEAVSIAFNEPGEYAYHCTFHAQNMKGRVLVTAP
jgi:plastocyanin